MLLRYFEGDSCLGNHLVGEWLGLGVEELELLERRKKVLGDWDKLA